MRLSWTGKESGGQRFDKILVAAGRSPNLKGLDLGKTGIALDAHGTPCFDRTTQQCDGSSIFIAGDADHDRPVLHEAAAEGILAGRNAASFPVVASGIRAVPLAIVFTDPPYAVVGKVPEKGEAHVRGRACICARCAQQGGAGP